MQYLVLESRGLEVFKLSLRPCGIHPTLSPSMPSMSSHRTTHQRFHSHSAVVRIHKQGLCGTTQCVCAPTNYMNDDGVARVRVAFWVSVACITLLTDHTLIAHLIVASQHTSEPSEKRTSRIGMRTSRLWTLIWFGWVEEAHLAITALLWRGSLDRPTSDGIPS